MIPPLFSKKFIDEFTHDHPIQSWFIIAFGLGMLGFTIWVIFAK